MSEQEEAELFSRALDERLAGRAAQFPPDPGAWAAAGRLAAADLSGGAAPRESMRALLVSRERARSRRVPAFVAAPAWACAALILLLLPLRVLRGSAPPPPLLPRGENGLPVLSGRFELPANARTESPFAAIAGAPFAAAAGRVVESAGTRAVEFDLGGSAYRLETRRTSLDEIFVKPVLGGPGETATKGGRYE